MPKFSIIVPVYNVENYIKKCLDSIFDQTYKDYEVIVVNDGTKDNSMNIVNNYKVKIVTQKNQGLSAARNHGVEKAKGEYLIFLDSDDYWDKDLLLNLSESITNNPDVVRFQIKEVYENSDKEIEYKEQEFEGLDGVSAFNKIVKYHYVENAWCYAIKRSYYLKEKFSFKKGTIHEDYGLIPLVIIKAQSVNSISYVGYNYLQRQGSIMSTKNYEKTLKKVSDMYEHYHYLINEINKTNLDSKIFKSYVANSMILKTLELEPKEYKEYQKKLKADKIFNNILSDTIPRKIKKIILKISPRLYYKVTK